MTRVHPQHHLLLQWTSFCGVLVFGLWLAWRNGWLAQVFDNDPTRLSLLIGCVFLGATAHCAARARYLSGQLNQIRAIRVAADRGQKLALQGEALRLGGRQLPYSLPGAYLQALLGKGFEARAGGSEAAPISEPSGQLSEVLAEQAHGQHEIGWFITGLLIKLGLLGTVIGFVLMLGSVSTMESFDISDVQNVLRQMTVGMSVALNTTLVGLIGSMLLGFQYLLLDRAADKLVADTVHYAEVELARPARADSMP